MERNLTIKTPDVEIQERYPAYNSQNYYQFQELNNIHGNHNHMQYQPPEKIENISTPPILPNRTERATEKEIRLVKQYYRHVNIHDKIPQDDYFTFGFMYAPPNYQVRDYASKLSGRDSFENAAIETFKQAHTLTFKTEDITLADRNLGITATFGKRIAYDARSEWQFFMFQGRFVGDDGIKDSSTGTFVVEFYEPTIDDDVTFSYRNVEFIQRTIGLHYNLVKEFKSLFVTEKIVPYVLGGVGISTQWHALRLSNGRLGMAGITGGRLTKQEYFSFKPSFSLAGGFTYRLSQRFALDFKFSSIQMFNEINSKNYIIQSGITFFY